MELLLYVYLYLSCMLLSCSPDDYCLSVFVFVCMCCVELIDRGRSMKCFAEGNKYSLCMGVIEIGSSVCAPQRHSILALMAPRQCVGRVQLMAKKTKKAKQKTSEVKQLVQRFELMAQKTKKAEQKLEKQAATVAAMVKQQEKLQKGGAEEG